MQQPQLPQLVIPKPKQKMRTFNWNKLPVNKILGKRNIWSLVAKNNEEKKGKAKAKKAKLINFEDMEHLFCQQAPAPPQQQQAKEEKSGKDDSVEMVNLLDHMRSLNIKLFLKQIRSSNEDIVQMVRDGDHDVFGADNLKGLVKILPEQDEIETLKSFDGDKARLGDAERFILQLVEVPK